MPGKRAVHESLLKKLNFLNPSVLVKSRPKRGGGWGGLRDDDVVLLVCSFVAQPAGVTVSAIQAALAYI